MLRRRRWSSACRVQNVEYEFHPEYWGHVSPEAKELVSRMLTKDTKARVTAAEALAHPWVRLAPIYALI